MNTSAEQEAFSLVIQKQKDSALVSDIRFAFQHFMVIADLAIEEAVAQLLSDPAQATLAERQMATV